MNQTIISKSILATLPPSALALHQDAVDFFANGGSIHNAASHYAEASDTFYHRALVWIVANGFNRLPANEKGKAPKIAQMEAISADSKNRARAMAQEVYALSWTLTAKGFDVFEFASLRTMRDAGRAKDKELANVSTVGTLTEQAEQAPEQAEQAPKHEVASADLAILLEQRSMLELLQAELNKTRPSMATLKKIAGIAV